MQRAVASNAARPSCVNMDLLSALSHQDIKMNLKTWKSGQHDPELLHSVNQAKRFRLVCPYCMEHKRTCPVCAGVI